MTQTKRSKFMIFTYAYQAFCLLAFGFYVFYLFASIAEGKSWVPPVLYMAMIGIYFSLGFRWRSTERTRTETRKIQAETARIIDGWRK